jgi:endonuclease/exonuclease/phosphatase family metal-dependent hydrolase
VCAGGSISRQGHARGIVRGAGGTSIDISYDVRVAGNGIAQRHEQAPVPGARTHEAGFAERVGVAVRDRLGAVGLTAGIGAVAGAFALRRSPLLAIAGGIAGALVGGLVATGTSMALPSAARLQAAGASPAPTEVVEPEHVRVMTINLRGGLGKENLSAEHPLPHPREHLDAIAEQIRREHPDIVLFQEFDGRHVRSLMIDELQYFADALHPDDAIAAQPHETVGSMFGRVGGQAMLTFNGFRIDNARELWSPDQPTYGTLDALVRTPAGTYLRAMSTHQHGERGLAQLDELAPSIDAWDGPTILGGDFNRSSGTPEELHEAATLGAVGLRDAFHDVGIDDRDPRRKSFRSGSDIDRFQLSPQLTAERVEVLDDDPWHSDHRSVVADLRLANGS